MKKNFLALICLFFSVLLLATGCGSKKSKYTKYSATVFDCFNTVTTFTAYTETEEEFNQYYQYFQERFEYLHQLYDIYNSYEGINNLKTINDNAGIKPVKVEQEIIDLILFAKEWYAKTGGKTNIAMGAVLKIWHDYRTEGIDFPQEAKLPPQELLAKAAKHIDLDKVIVNEEEKTVFLADPEMSLDVGAVAKGFATEIVIKELQAKGLTSGVIDAGGNIRTIGKPGNGERQFWSVGIQDPDGSIFSNTDIIDVAYVENASVVSSGDYQRYYFVDGKLYHHIIDPETLMPGTYYRAVTVITEDSGVADFLSTTLFLLPFDQALPLAESLEDVEALWIMHDGSIKKTSGMKKILKSEGAKNR
ncbi:MAG: FAD:protein FMN transferase [Firmicutes bacterium]|nr:FAD:protein FMN transferase [Bacillota bacterium]